MGWEGKVLFTQGMTGLHPYVARIPGMRHWLTPLVLCWLMFEAWNVQRGDLLHSPGVRDGVRPSGRDLNKRRDQPIPLYLLHKALSSPVTGIQEPNPSGLSPLDRNGHGLDRAGTPGVTRTPTGVEGPGLVGRRPFRRSASRVVARDVHSYY